MIGAAMYNKFLSSYKYFMDQFGKFACVLCILLFAVIVGITTMEVFTRYFLNYSSVKAAEIQLLLSDWMYFLGFVVILIRGENLVMEYFFNKLPGPVRQVVDWLTHLAILLFLFIVLKECISLRALTNLMDHQVLPVKQSFVNLPLLIGSFLAILVTLYSAWVKTDQLIRSLMRKTSQKE